MIAGPRSNAAPAAQGHQKESLARVSASGAIVATSGVMIQGRIRPNTNPRTRREGPFSQSLHRRERPHGGDEKQARRRSDERELSSPVAAETHDEHRACRLVTAERTDAALDDEVVVAVDDVEREDGYHQKLGDAEGTAELLGHA